MSPSPAGRYDGRSTSSGYANVVLAAVTSFGRSMTTGPGRPLRAMWNASLTTRARSRTSFTM